MKILQAIYQIILDGLVQGKNGEAILDRLQEDRRSAFLKIDEAKNTDTKRNFDTDTKSTAFLRDALKSALKCKICQGLIHTNSISIDHKDRKQDGGFGNLDNAELTHPYCNTTYKN